MTDKERFSQTPAPGRYDRHRRDRTPDTPVPTEDWLGKNLFSATPAPLRHVAARMNEAAIGVVHNATSMVMWAFLSLFMVGALLIVVAIADLTKHHLFGSWPAYPEAERLEMLETENSEQRAEIDRLREALIKRLDQAHPLSGETAQ